MQLTDACMLSTGFQSFSGSPLNRLHLHRKDAQRMGAMPLHDKARFLLLNARLQPLLRTLPLAAPPSAESASHTAASRLLPPVVVHMQRRAVIAWLTRQQLASAGIGIDAAERTVVLLGQVDNEAPIARRLTVEGELRPAGDDSQPQPQPEPDPSVEPPLPVNDGSLEEDAPYHAVLLISDEEREAALSLLRRLEAGGGSSEAASPSASSCYDYHELRSAMPLLNYSDAAVLAQSRALLEWHQASLHCGRCGALTVSREGGANRQCSRPQPPQRAQPAAADKTLTANSSIAPVVSPAQPASAAASPLLSAVAPSAAPVYCGRTLYPRTDCVTITLVVSNDGRRVLLGRKREFPAGVYTCLAGFLEGGETPEEGAKREVWEESGVTVGAVRYFTSQPWPFLGGQLMMGFLGQAAAGEEAEAIRLLDGELESARWFTREELGAMLAVSRSRPEGWANPAAFNNALRLPPCYAIAHQLCAEFFVSPSPFQLTAAASGAQPDAAGHSRALAHL